MKIKIIFFVFFAIVFFFACVKSNHVVEKLGDGRIMAEYDTLENGLVDGVYKKYYESGSLSVKCVYQNGLKDGTYFEFFEDGSIKLKGKFIKGKETGDFFEYYSNGNIKAELGNQLLYVGKEMLPDICNDSLDTSKKESNLVYRFFYGLDGKLINDSSFFHIATAFVSYSGKSRKQKTKVVENVIYIKRGDTLNFFLKVECPFYKSPKDSIEFVFRARNSEHCQMFNVFIPNQPQSENRFCFMPELSGKGFFYGTITEINRTLNMAKVYPFQYEYFLE